MTKERKQEYTLRISQANRTQLVVILYEILLDYLEDAKEAHRQQDHDLFASSIYKSESCIRELIASLHMEYTPAGNLFQLYVYAIKELSKAVLHNSTEEIHHVETMMTRLHDAYETISKEDTSAPVMKNTQSIYAGLTYGKNQLMESLSNEGRLRGVRA